MRRRARAPAARASGFFSVPSPERPSRSSQGHFSAKTALRDPTPARARATLSPRSPPERPKTAHRGPESSPRPPTEAPRVAQDRPLRVQEQLETAHKAPRVTQDSLQSSKSRPRLPTEGLTAPHPSISRQFNFKKYLEKTSCQSARRSSTKRLHHLTLSLYSDRSSLVYIYIYIYIYIYKRIF